MTAKRVISRIGISSQVPSLKVGEFGYDTDTKNIRIGDDTSNPPKTLTDKTETFDLTNLKDLKLSAEVLDVLARRGVDGWTPVIGTKAVGDKEFLEIKDWVGGEGDKPEYPVYVSNTGFTTDPNLATNIKGKKGSDASGPVISFSIDNGSLLMNVLNPDETQAPIGGYVDDDGYLIIEYEAINGTTIHTSLGKVLVRFRGAYSPITTYHPLDEVTENNKLYRVKYDSEPVQGIYVNNINHWSLILDYDLSIESDVWTAQVDTLLDRATYDNYEPGTTIIVNNVGDGKAAVYTRIGIAGNWTNPAYLTGPEGNAYESYGVNIYKADGITVGGYYSDRQASANSLQKDIFIEVLNGDVGSSIDIYLEVNGDMVAGPYTVITGIPTSLTDVDISIDKGDSVSWVISGIFNGEIREIFAKSYGAVS